MTNQEILNKYSNMEPGKYWSLPANKKHLIDSYMADDNYFSMVKYDGYWSRTIITDRKVLIQSRGISKVTGTYGDYTELVPHLVQDLLDNYPDGTVILGELAFNDLSRKASEVGSVLRCLPKKAVERQKDEKNKIHLFVFDVLCFGGQELINLNFEDRFKPSYVLGENSSSYIHAPLSSSADHAAEMLEWVWSKGGEGIILVNKKMPYNIGNAKAWHSIKVKREIGDIEGKVIDVIGPKKEYEGKDLENWKYFEDGVAVTKPYYYGRAVGVVVEYKGRVVNITSGTTEDDGDYLMGDAAKMLIKNGQLTAVFTGMEITEDSIRHPRLLRLRDEA